MLNKIAFIIFVSVFSIASTVTLTSEGRTQNNSSKLPTIVNATSSEGIKKQVVNVESSESQKISSQGTGKSNAILPGSGWLLVMALFGFVMLSNRSSI
jgi:hypothetical protein